MSACCSAWLAPAVEPDAAGIEFFEKKIRPVLVKYCFECHSGESKSLKSNLRLDSRDAVLQVGDSGANVVAGIGIDHEKLTYHYSGRDYRLTDVHGRVVRDILA